MPAAAFAAVPARQALPRTLLPADVAATVAFLASDGAAALTGRRCAPTAAWCARHACLSGGISCLKWIAPVRGHRRFLIKVGSSDLMALPGRATPSELSGA